MSVPSLYNANAAVDVATGVTTTIFQSPFYTLFGADNSNGIWIEVAPESPSAVNNLLGYAHFTLGVQGVGSRSSVYSAPVVADLATVFAYPEILSSRQANVLFYPVAGLIRYTVRSVPIT